MKTPRKKERSEEAKVIERKDGCRESMVGC